MNKGKSLNLKPRTWIRTRVRRTLISELITFTYSLLVGFISVVLTFCPTIRLVVQTCPWTCLLCYRFTCWTAWSPLTPWSVQISIWVVLLKPCPQFNVLYWLHYLWVALRFKCLCTDRKNSHKITGWSCSNQLKSAPVSTVSDLLGLSEKFFHRKNCLRVVEILADILNQECFSQELCMVLYIFHKLGHLDQTNI